MPETDNILLTDRMVYPSDEIIFSLIGDKKTFWHALMKHMSDNFKDSSGIWTFYNDGKRWLFKMTRKKKTIFWAAILTGTFRITFYLGNKADAIIDESDLPGEIKEGFKTAKRYGQIRPISILVNNNSDLDNVKSLIDIKSKLK